MFKPQLLSGLKNIIPQSIQKRINPYDFEEADFLKKAADDSSPQTLILDAGAGECRYKSFFSKNKYISIDSAQGDVTWNYNNLDIKGTLYHLPFRSNVFDVVLNIVVLEHVKEPKEVLMELNRVLKPGGLLYIAIPLSWELHQVPHDYYRFTSFGLKYILESSEFKIVSLTAIGGFFWLLGRRIMGILEFFQKGWKYIIFFILAPVLGFIIPFTCYYLDRFDKEQNYTLGYFCIAKKQ